MQEYEAQKKSELKVKQGKWKLTTKEKKKFIRELGLFPRTEVGFTIAWNDPLGRTHYLRGSIDRVDLFNGGYVISDYKSDGSVRNQQTDISMASKPHQFTIYNIAAEQLFGNKPKATFLYHLRTNTVHPIVIDDSHIVTLAEDLKEAEETIQSGKFERNIGYHCKSCDFHNVCLASSGLASPERTKEQIDKDIEEYWSEVEISNEGDE